jgi:hypothetical protein
MKPKQLIQSPVKTVLVITVSLLILYMLTKWRWAIWASLLIGLAGLLSGYLAKMIDFFWMKLAWVLGLIFSNILLTILFCFFLTPIALLSRLFRNKNQMILKNSALSLFKDCKKDFEKASFEKPW